jgi:iron complex outermembrane receptor protein
MIRALLAVAAFCSATGAATADEPTDAAGPALEEVVVSATRTNRTVREVPAAVSVVGREDIQLGRQQLGLDEALGRVPGLFAQNRYNFAQDLRLSIRGFGARANFGIRGLKLIADGIPATTADGQSGVDDIDLGSLDRIEVIRGPSSSLYGASSGGVINLMTEDGPERPFVEAGVTLGEHDQQRYQLKAGGQTGRLNYLASASHLAYDGYREQSRVESTIFNSKFRYDIDSASNLTVIVNLVDSPTAEDAGAITQAQVEEDPRQAQARNVSSNAGESIEQQKLGIIYDRALDDRNAITLRNYYVWRDFQAFLPIGTHIPFVADDGVVEFDRFFWGGGIQWRFADSLFGRPFQMSAGVDADIQEDDRQRYLNEAGVKGALAFDQLEKAEAYGAYLRGEIGLADSVRLSLGIRWDTVDLSVDDRYLDNADQSADLDFDELSPSVGLVWDLGENWSAYANYATAFETPTFTELAVPARDLDVSLGGFANVSAQEAQSFEVGLRGGLLDGALYVEAAAFTMEVDDEITSVSNIGNRSFFANADTDRRGIETFATLALEGGLELSLAYTYSDFEFDRFEDNEDFEGNALPGLPDHQLFAEIKYRHSSGVYAVADVLHVSKLYVNNANSGTSEASTVANLRVGASLALGQWQLDPFLGVNNLFDENYISNVRINGFGGRLFEPAPKRNIYGGVAVRYVLR